ncbi:hypothetical protein [Candidatus Tisiphia endosymbiont of Micropterix aruncella]|uniref:hypothetical protein n=1 Tax=Candidatus Tisiphia endosymbiont of Micropterix aruncella TaxID=3066271 RepID=UPI003AA8E172
MGYSKHSKVEKVDNNRRNGSYEKTVIDDDGRKLRQFGIRISKNALAITNTRFWICINCISVNSYINCSS